MSQTFGAISRNIVPFLVLSIIIVGVPTLILSWLSAELNPVLHPANGLLRSQGKSALYSLLSLLISLAKWMLTSILTGAVVQGVVSDLNGTRPTLAECFATGLRFILPVAGASLLFGLGVGAGLVVLLVPGFILLTMWCVAIPAVVLEKTGVFGAFSRSRELTKGHRWTLFWLMFLYGVVVMILNVTLLALVGGFANPLALATKMSSLGVIITTTIVGVASNLVSSAGVATIYYELRTIKDGVAPSALASVFD